MKSHYFPACVQSCSKGMSHQHQDPDDDEDESDSKTTKYFICGRKSTTNFTMVLILLKY